VAVDDDLQPMVTDWERALAVVAHPDDVEFGAAGAVAGWTKAGKTVTYMILTRGEAGIDTMPPEQAAPVREAEQRTSAGLVGVSTVDFLDYRDGVITYSVDLRRDIARALRRYRPDLVVMYNHHDTFPGGKANTPDHRYAGQAVLDAIGDAGNRWIFPDLEGEPWNGVRYVAVANSPQPTHGVDITDTLEVAIGSLDAHRAYLNALGIDSVRERFTAIVHSFGERFGGRPTVPFELYRR